MNDPSFGTEGTRAFDALFAGDFPRHEEEVTIASGENLTRGTVLGHITGGDWVPVDDSLANGAEVARAVLAEDVDASAAAKKGTAYRTGAFAESEVTFGGDDVVADHRDAAAEKGIFFREVTDGL